jgi:hypothetical protein
MFRLRNIATLATLGLAAAALPHAAVAQQTLYVANNGNNTIEKINSSGSSQFTVSGGLNDPQGLAFDSSGNLYVANESDFRSSTIYKYNTTTGSGIQIANGGAVSSPIGLAFDSVGNLYAANNHSNSLTKLTSSGSASVFGLIRQFWQSLCRQFRQQHHREIQHDDRHRHTVQRERRFEQPRRSGLRQWRQSVCRQFRQQYYRGV